MRPQSSLAFQGDGVEEVFHGMGQAHFLQVKALGGVHIT